MKKVFATSFLASLASLFMSALVLVGCTTSNPDPAQNAVRKSEGQLCGEIDYHFYQNDDGLERIVAEVGGKEYTIPCQKMIACDYLDLEAVMDFDRDGYLDVLIAAQNMLDSSRAFYFVSYQGNGYFAVSDQFGQCVDYKIAYTMDETSIEVMNSEERDDGQYDLLHQTFSLVKGKAVKTSETKEKRIEGTLLQIVPIDVPYGKEDYSLTFDLNGDGKQDSIVCSPGETDCNGFDPRLVIGDNDLALPFTDRLGVLPTKTNGYHDLVLSINTILIWDGEEYVEKE